MVGHLLGASGAVEAVAAVQACRQQRLHPNPNLINPDPQVDLDKLVGRTAEEWPVDVCLSNSFGFGGHNSTVVFARYDPEGDYSSL